MTEFIQRYEGMLFDIDDTLIDFKGSMALSLKDSYRSFFKDIVDFSSFEKQYQEINHQLWNLAEIGEISTRDIGRERFKQLTQKLGIDFNSVIPEHYETKLVENSQWIDGAAETLLQLMNSGIKIGYITNGFAHVQRAKYEFLGLKRFSEVLIISEEVGHSKPHPKIFEVALSQMNTPPGKTLVIGDSLSSDGKGAMESGMDFCWYNPDNCEINPSCAIRYQIQNIMDLHQHLLIPDGAQS